MTGKIEILVPTGESVIKDKGISLRVDNLNGKVIGFLDNSWNCYVSFLDRIQELLQQQYQPKAIIRKTKLDRGLAASRELLDELAASCQVVINGLCA